MSAPTDDRGRGVFLVTWGAPARPDWAAALVVAHDEDEAVVVAREAHPERKRPVAAGPASEPVARAVLAGQPSPAAPLPVLR